MVFQDDITVQFEAAVLLQKSPGIQHDVDNHRTGKQRQPVVDGRGQEMWAGILDDLIATAGHVIKFGK